MADLYVRASDGTTKGPFPQAKINQYIAQGRMTGETAVSDDGRNWTMLGQHSAFGSHFSNNGNSTASNRFVPKIHKPTPRKSSGRSPTISVNSTNPRLPPRNPNRSTLHHANAVTGARKPTSALLIVTITTIIVTGLCSVFYLYVLPYVLLDKVVDDFNDAVDELSPKGQGITLDQLKAKMKAAHFYSIKDQINEQDLIDKIGHPAFTTDRFLIRSGARRRVTIRTPRWKKPTPRYSTFALKLWRSAGNAIPTRIVTTSCLTMVRSNLRCNALRRLV